MLNEAELGSPLSDNGSRSEASNPPNDTSDDFYNNEKKCPISVRERIFLTMTESSYSPLAYCLSFYFDGLVALSMVLMCSETVVSWSSTTQQQAMWGILETIITMNFLVDFVLKVSTARPLLKYMKSRATFTIDLLGLLPYFTERIVQQVSQDEAASIKALRVLRLLRFFRLSRIAYENFPDVRMFIQAIRRSKLAIAFLGMYVFGAGLFFASCIYFAETSECYLDATQGIWFYSGRSKEEACAIQNMYSAWWFTLVTMTTVGYGDTVITSPWGRILTVLMMIASLVFLALPSAIFAANLTEMYLERRLMKKLTLNTTSMAANGSNTHHNHHQQIGLEKKMTLNPLVSPSDSESSHPSTTTTTTNKGDLEIQKMATNVGILSDQVNSALSLLSSHLSLLNHQQSQLQTLLKEKLHSEQKRNSNSNSNSDSKYNNNNNNKTK